MEIEKKEINVEQLSQETGIDLSKYKFDYHLETMEFKGLEEPDLTTVKNAIKTHIPIFPKKLTTDDKLNKIINMLGSII